MLMELLLILNNTNEKRKYLVTKRNTSVVASNVPKDDMVAIVSKAPPRRSSRLIKCLMESVWLKLKHVPDGQA